MNSPTGVYQLKHFTIRLLLFLVVTFANVYAQTNPTIRGSVEDAATGIPLPGIDLYVDRGSPHEIKATTNAQGRYTLTNVAIGNCRISASDPGDQSRSESKIIKLIAGQDLSSVNFRMKGYGTISGRILDEAKEPLTGMTVFLIAREYRFGTMKYVFAGVAPTNDKGEYVLKHVEAGRSHLIMVKKWRRLIEPLSAEPASVEKRPRAWVPTYYPSGPYITGAQAITLRPSEKRENIDIQMSSSLSFCLDGVLEANGHPAALRFELEEQDVTSGTYGDSGSFVMPINGTSGSDGKVRICSLHTGQYRLTAMQGWNDKTLPTFFGTVSVAISDGDETNVTLIMQPRFVVSGEVAWFDKPPDDSVRLYIRLLPVARATLPGESRGLTVEAAVPSQISFGEMILGDYGVEVRNLPSKYYLKEVIYGGFSALHEPARVGSVSNQFVRVILGTDGGSLTAKVIDKDGNPISSSHLFIMPKQAASEAHLADEIIFGQADQDGAFTSAALAPGKYLVLAGDLPLDRAPEIIGKLWSAKSQALEVEIGPGSAIQVTLSPAAL